MPDLLSMSQHLPLVELDAGDLLIEDGQRTGSVWVLESGSVEILKDGVRISIVNRPGVSLGEIAAILGSAHTASVRATEPCVLRFAQDGRALLLSDPELLLSVAAGLAERLDLITHYLADLRNQYATAPGLTMVSDVLGRLSGSPSEPPQTGSTRDPDPEY